MNDNPYESPLTARLVEDSPPSLANDLFSAVGVAIGVTLVGVSLIALSAVPQLIFYGWK